MLQHLFYRRTKAFLTSHFLVPTLVPNILPQETYPCQDLFYSATFYAVSLHEVPPGLLKLALAEHFKYSDKVYLTH